MTRKSTIAIEQDIFIILESFFEGKISGKFYPSDCRPANSKLEDAVLTVSKVSSEQIQDGRARINIYVSDIDNNSGCLVPDKERLQELASLDEKIVEILNAADTDYDFDLFQGTDIIADSNINQHFVNINLELKRITFNS